ncbi:hypothetical protein ST47_g5062 [Ascochyta rabiei]|uniref:Uncharacterized protein n=1 Tax=Didymella rabiei TaxID=5454 RepID=A0A163EMM4_DIDRA|nr:hypothetical protein ST47_g5062 [Ascochyta rabiei]
MLDWDWTDPAACPVQVRRQTSTPLTRPQAHTSAGAWTAPNCGRGRLRFKLTPGPPAAAPYPGEHGTAAQRCSLRRLDTTTYKTDDPLVLAQDGSSSTPPRHHARVRTRALVSFPSAAVFSFPSAALVNFPSAALVNFPSAALVNFPSAALVSFPSAAVFSFPSAALVNFPSAALVNFPSAALVSFPSAALVNFPSAALVSFPSGDSDGGVARANQPPLSRPLDVRSLAHLAPKPGARREMADLHPLQPSRGATVSPRHHSPPVITEQSRSSDAWSTARKLDCISNARRHA